MWRNLNAEFAKGAREEWQALQMTGVPLPVHLMNGAIKGLVWGPGDHLSWLQLPKRDLYFEQSVLHRKHSQNYSIVQVNENEVAIHRTGDNKDRYKKSIEAGINIAGLDVFGNTVALWSGQKVEVYSLEDGDDGVKRIGTFPSRSQLCFTGTMHIYCGW